MLPAANREYIIMFAAQYSEYNYLAKIIEDAIRRG